MTRRGSHAQTERDGESPAETGRTGESLAARFLETSGLEILSRNWRSGRRELDLVARDGDVVAFVEVKTRREGPQSSIEALAPAQRRRLRAAAEAWIQAHPGTGREFRFDVVGVTLRRGFPPAVTHLAGAFTGDDC